MSESTPVRVPGKVCTKCGKFKSLIEYSPHGKGRTRNACKVCVAAYQRARYQSDAEVRAKHKVLRDRWRAENPTYFAEYYQDNREKAIAAAVEYERRNPVDPERRRQRHRAWYAATREQRKAASALWRESNLEVVRETGRRAQSRRRARLQGLPFEFYTMSDLLERDGLDCVLCDEPLDLAASHPDSLAPTVEHLECIAWPDSAGDVLTNVAVAHFTCNCQRGDRPHPAAARKRAELLAVEQELPA